MVEDDGLLASVLRASIIAVLPFSLWCVGRFGTKKAWYFQASSTSIAFGVARFWYYVMPFLAVSFLFFGVDDFFLGKNPQEGSIWSDVAIGCLVVGLICGFLQPDWLSPGWLRRLRREHGKILPYLLEDAIGMHKAALESRTQTWSDLETWIAEVQHKRKIE